ncbi:MAG: family 43 glycosylhydrolase, partial [Oscillospiraceae bacterium]|nr:family 43 glycosylhydrolase [Oscillospiraceae bacterium]
YLSIGCDVQVTELDISLNSGEYSLQDQATKYKAIFQAAMDWNKNPQSDGRVTAVCIWGPNDANSWLKSGSDALLYDKNNNPKLAYTTLMNMEVDGSTVPSTGGTVEPNDFGWYFDDGFEGSLCDWAGRGAASVSTSGRTAFVGSEALLVQDRTAAWNGAYKTLNPKVFVAGNEYCFSAIVNYFDGDATDTFYLKLQYTDGNGDTQYSTVAEATGVKGSWVQLCNTNYQIPADASNMQLYVETAETTNNFYIDEVIGAVAGTGIKGPDPVQIPVDTSKNQKGDADGNKTINIFDLMAAKRAAASGTYSKAVDVDENGVVDAEDIKQIQDYLHGRIKVFTVVEKPTVNVDTAKMEQLFSSVTPVASYKKEGENNPLYTQRFGADPGVMEYNGRVYVYMTDDTIEYDSNGKVQENGYGLINRINCISSDDMVNWTDHGAIPVAGSNGIAKFANNSWAPCAAHKTINGKEKFFLYFCNGGNGVCVLTADSPTGPWSDPLGGPLVTRAVPNCGDIPWLFDPAVFVDNDGTGYLCFGGGVPDGKTAMPSTTRVVKLSDDMIHLDGTPVTINAPYVFEDSGINRIGNKYYYTYCSNWNTGGNQYGLSNAGIEYMVADNPLGPYTYGGELFKNQGNFFAGMTGNNHHSIVELNGKLYLFYHSRPVEKAMGIDGNYRSPQVDQITMSGDKINSVTGTMTGIAQLKKINPYETNQAEMMSSQSKDISVSGLGDTTVSGGKGSWLKVSGVDFSNGAKTLTVKASSKSGSAIKVCTGLTGSAVAYAEIPAGGMTEITVPVIDAPNGTTALYFLFSADTVIDSWSFS